MGAPLDGKGEMNPALQTLTVRNDAEFFYGGSNSIQLFESIWRSAWECILEGIFSLDCVRGWYYHIDVGEGTKGVVYDLVTCK